MNGNTRLIILAVAAVAALGFITAAIAFRPARAEPDNSPALTLAAPPGVTLKGEPQPRQQTEEWLYLVRSYGGQVAIYKWPETDKPETVTAILTDALPRADRERLVEGIPIYTELDLTRIMEDLGT